MQIKKNLFLLALILIFILGLYATMFFKIDICSDCKENMENANDTDESSCPDVLIKKDDQILLYNSKDPSSENNPRVLSNLDEYIKYLETQREKGINCPVLYLQQESNAQGEDVYRVRPSPFEMEGGLPSNANLSEGDKNKINNAIRVLDGHRDNAQYNTNQHAGFDAHGQHVGEYTELDELHNSTKKNKHSDNPMDPNWAGTEYTKNAVKSGKYKDNEIYKPVFFKPKTVYYPDKDAPMGGPKDILE
jgi:hypothetical protein